MSANSVFFQLFLGVVFALTFIFSSSTPALAAPTNCTSLHPGFSVTGNWPSNPVMGSEYAPVQLQINGLQPGQYKVQCAVESFAVYQDLGVYTNLQTTPGANGRGNISLTISDNNCFKHPSGLSKTHNHGAFVKVELQNDPSSACTVLNYTLSNATDLIDCNSSNFTIADSAGLQGCFEAGTTVSWSLQNVKYENGNPANGTFQVRFANATVAQQTVTLQNGAASGTSTLGSAGTPFKITLADPAGQAYCNTSREVFALNSCTKEDKEKPPVNAGNNGKGFSPYYVCNQISGPNATDLKAKCEACSGTPGDPKSGIWTAVGCIQSDAKSIVTQMIQIGLGLAGGVALLMIIAAGFLITTSQNDPKKVTDAREMVTSAVIGLLFIVFSVTILQFIGVTILRIPGFGT